MIEFLRDPETGYVYAYKDGVLVGGVESMGDKPPSKPSCDLWKLERGSAAAKARKSGAVNG